jgi:hypothetical protein
MFPETDDLPRIISDALKVMLQRRLVDRVLRLWLETANEREFPRYDQIRSAILGTDWTNCFVIAVRSPVRFDHVGENLSFMRCRRESLAGVLLSHLPQVLGERRCLMIEGRDRLRDAGILYRGALYPLSDDGIVIDHVLGAAGYRLLREDEDPRPALLRTKWL